MKNIVWLASYPKSGNTWFRAFLSSLLNKNITEELNINDLERTPIASARPLFEDHTGLESSELTLNETELLRPYVYKEISDSAESRMYMKVHDAFTKTSENTWIFPPEATFGAVYFIRNPLDVAVSFSYHNSHEIDATINNMNDPNFALCKSKRTCPNQLKQKHLTWSGHVESWTQAPLKVCALRYEDMLLDSFATFKKAVTFLELDKSDELIHQAIVNSSFDKLREQEEKIGFHEKVYENSLMILLKNENIKAVQQFPIPVYFKGDLVGDYCADIIVEDKIIIELKSVENLSDAHIAQTLNYLKATELKLALLLNFGQKKLYYKRVIF